LRQESARLRRECPDGVSSLVVITVLYNLFMGLSLPTGLGIYGYGDGVGLVEKSHSDVASADLGALEGFW